MVSDMHSVKGALPVKVSLAYFEKKVGEENEVPPCRREKKGAVSVLARAPVGFRPSLFPPFLELSDGLLGNT